MADDKCEHGIDYRKCLQCDYAWAEENFTTSQQTAAKIRAKALEEAAQIAERITAKDDEYNCVTHAAGREIAAAIRAAATVTPAAHVQAQAHDGDAKQGQE